MNHYPSEKGQAIVFLAISIIVLLGFAALAIDGGMAYSDRRQAQNGADASSLAGGGAAAAAMEEMNVTYGSFACSGNKYEVTRVNALTAARARAMTNGFDVESEETEVNRVEFSCNANHNNGSWIEKYVDITTRVSNVTELNLAQVLYGGELRNNVAAVTRVRPRSPLAFGNAVVALGTECGLNTGGIRFDGNIDTRVVGGGMFSNSCVRAGSNNTIEVDEQFGITCTGPSCASNWSNAAPVTMGSQTMPRSAFEIPEPDCAGLPNRGIPDLNNPEPLQPGRYRRITVNGGRTANLAPGLFCIEEGFTANGGGEVFGMGVTIFAMGGNSDIDLSGGSNVYLSAPERDCPHCPPAIPGVLLYVSNSSRGNVAIAGGNGNEFRGLIYVPNGSIDVVGNSTTAAPIHAQLVGQTVKISGNAFVDITFDDSMNYSIPTRIELFK